MLLKMIHGIIYYFRFECEHECYLYKEGYLKTHTIGCKLAKRG